MAAGELGPKYRQLLKTIAMELYVGWDLLVSWVQSKGRIRVWRSDVALGSRAKGFRGWQGKGSKGLAGQGLQEIGS